MILNHTEDPLIRPKHRKPWIAFLLSALIPGLGQIYNGQARKGLICICILYLAIGLFGITRWVTSFQGFASLLFINASFWIFIVIDAVVVANQQKDFVPKKYNTWLYYILFAVLFWIFSGYVNGTSVANVESAKIATTSGCPTLQPKEYVIVDTKAYQDSTPNYGDLVVFYNSQKERHTFRVVGLPNDVVSSDEKGLVINGRLCPSTRIKDTTCDTQIVSEYIEELPNGHKHSIYRDHDPKHLRPANFGDVQIPEGYYFLMGDNRENALDSRYIGIIPMNDIIGRLAYIFWSKDLNRVGVDLQKK